jgi:hypothetical protein
VQGGIRLYPDDNGCAKTHSGVFLCISDCEGFEQNDDRVGASQDVDVDVDVVLIVPETIIGPFL